MIAIDLTLGAAIYVAIGVLLVVGLWCYYDWRDRRMFEGSRRHVTFHCVKCGHLYRDEAGAETAHCSHCGQPNVRLKF